MTDTVPDDVMLHDPAEALDPLADAEDAVGQEPGQGGVGRPSSLLYTYGPGAIMDLPAVHDHAGRARRLGPDLEAPRATSRTIHRAAAAATSSACTCGSPGRRSCARSRGSRSRAASPTRATTSASRPGCSRSGCAAPDATCSACCPQFSYTNTHPFRTDLAASSTRSCPGRGRRTGAKPAAREPRGARPVPAGLRRRAPRRVPLRAVGAPRRERARRPSSPI